MPCRPQWPVGRPLCWCQQRRAMSLYALSARCAFVPLTFGALIFVTQDCPGASSGDCTLPIWGPRQATCLRTPCPLAWAPWSERKRASGPPCHFMTVAGGGRRHQAAAPVQVVVVPAAWCSRCAWLGCCSLVDWLLAMWETAACNADMHQHVWKVTSWLAGQECRKAPTHFFPLPQLD